MGSLYPDASQFSSKVAGGVCRAVCNKQPRRRRLVSSSAYRRASSRLVAGHNNRVSNSDSFRNKRVVCRRYCLTLLSFSFSVSLRPCCPLFGSRDKRLLLTIKTNRFVPLVRQDFPWLSRLGFSIISFPFFFRCCSAHSLYFYFAVVAGTIRGECRTTLNGFVNCLLFSIESFTISNIYLIVHF